MNEQEKVIDKLLDVPNVSETSVFDELVKVNNEAFAKFSSYILADMWNGSKAVKFGFANGRVAADFQ